MVVLSEDLISLIYIKEQQAHVETNQQEYTCAFFNKYFTCNYIWLWDTTVEFIAVLLRLMVYYFMLPSPVVCQGHFLLWALLNAVCVALVALILLCQTYQNNNRVANDDHFHYRFICLFPQLFINYFETIFNLLGCCPSFYIIVNGISCWSDNTRHLKMSPWTQRNVTGIFFPQFLT